MDAAVTPTGLVVTMPNSLLVWVTDITEHLTGERKDYCCAILDAISRKIVGWSIDNNQNSNLVVNALEMAIEYRTLRLLALTSIPWLSW